MKKHIKELDIYSGICILFVVFIHANANYIVYILNCKNYIEAGFFMNFLDKIVHVAVPMFIFIAGYKYEMNDKNKDYKDYLKNKFIKIGKPFLILSIFVIIYHQGGYYVKHSINNEDINILIVFKNTIKDFIKIFLGYNFAFQLWYIPLYFSIIIIYPIIYKVIKTDYIRFIYLCIIAILFSFVYHIYPTFLNKYPYPFKFIYYFYLFELGSIFYKKNLYFKNGNNIIFLYIAALLINSIIKNIMISDIFYDIVLTPIAVIAYYFISKKLNNIRLLYDLGKYSFYIFLFHEPIFLTYTFKLFRRFDLLHNYFIVILMVSISIALSILFYKFIEKSKIYIINLKR